MGLAEVPGQVEPDRVAGERHSVLVDADQEVTGPCLDRDLPSSRRQQALDVVALALEERGQGEADLEIAEDRPEARVSVVRQRQPGDHPHAPPHLELHLQVVPFFEQRDPGLSV